MIRPTIYKFLYRNRAYYAEGYDKSVVKNALSNKLEINIEELVDSNPSIKELKKIWNKKNTNYKLTLTKEQTTNQDDLKLFKKQQHCLYELNLFLNKDIDFLSGVNDIVLIDPANQVEMFEYKQFDLEGAKGYNICHSYRGSKKDMHTKSVYRFKSMYSAYEYIRNQLIKFELADKNYNEDLTNIEILDAYNAGFNSPDYCVKDGVLKEK